MKENALVIYSRSIGDTLCATPTLRKLYKTFNSKFSVVTHVPEIFERNPYVLNTYKFEDFSEVSLQKKFNVFKVFHNMSHKNLEGIEWKYGLISLQQSMAMDLGFMLLPEELSCNFYPRTECIIPELPKDYICIHPVQSWPSRTWSKEMWEQLIEYASKINMPIVSTGKDSSEKGFFNVDKPAYMIPHSNNINLINKLGLSETWNIINNAKIFITMDTGLLHLAGTTDTHIIQLGSSIHPYYRAPYRNGSQQYKYSYIKGSCNSFCASDMKYSLKEWGNIQAVPPLLGCLEGRRDFDCHPNFNQVFDECKNILNGNKIQSISVPIDVQISEVIPDSKIISIPENISKESLIEFTGFKNGKYFHFVYRGKEELSVVCLMSDDITNLSYYKTEMVLNPNIEYFFGIGDDGTPGTRFEIFDKLTMELIYKYVDSYVFNLDKIFYNLMCNNSTATAYPLKEIFTNREYDSEFVNVNEGDIVVDLGANVGLFALYALTRKCKKCYSVEAHPETFKYLKINTSDRFDNIITINKAISTVDNMYMDLNSQNSTGLSIYNNPKDYSVKVDSISLSQLIKEYDINMIDYLKIDIEGAEYDLLRNIDKTYLSNNVKKIALEVHRCSDDDFNFIKSLLLECSFNYIIVRSDDKGTNKMIHAWKKEKIELSSNIDFLGFNENAQRINFVYKGTEPIYVNAYIKDNYTNLTYYRSEMQLVPNIIYYVGIDYYSIDNKRIEIYNRDTNELIGRCIETGSKRIINPHEFFKNLSSNPIDEIGWNVVEIFDGEYYNDNCHIENGDIVVDLGANVGVFSLYALSKGCKKCYSIEAHPLTYSYLQKNLNRYNECVTINAAINNTADDVYMRKTTLPSGGAKTFEKNKDDSILIRSIIFSDFCKNYNIDMIDYLKIDIEGSEYKLFKNIDKEFLKTKVKKIAIEFHIIENEDYKSILSILSDCGFEWSMQKNQRSSDTYGTLLGWNLVYLNTQKKKNVYDSSSKFYAVEKKTGNELAYITYKHTDG